MQMSEILERSPSPRARAAQALLERGLFAELAPDGSLPARLRVVVACALLVAAAAAVGLVIESLSHVPNILLVFLPVVRFAAGRYGFWAATASSALSIAITSFFTPPVYSFAVSDPANVWALLMFTVVAAFTSSLATQLRQRAAAVAEHGRVLEQLYAFSTRLAAASSPQELVRASAERIGSMVGASAVVLLPERGGLRALDAAGEPVELDAPEQHAAAWCLEHKQPAGRGTGRFEGVPRLYLPLATAGGSVGVLGLARDPPGPILSVDQTRLVDALSRQLAVSLERARLAEEMRANEVLAETEKLRTALLTSITHDLKTPLASILGNVTSLRAYGHLYDPDTREDMLSQAEEETLRLDRFVDNLLHMTRIDAGALKPAFENVDLADLVGAALARAEKLTAQHVVRTELPPNLPMVPLNFVLAEHALVNLLDNAAKYAPAGSVITIAVEDRPDDIVLVVTDEGPGIPPEDLERIFQRFFRASATDHRRAGAGLGLAICKGFVEAMGGRITARNRTDRTGAVFTVTLPKQRIAGTSG